MLKRLVVLLLGGSLLACAGLGADSSTDTAASPGDTGSTGPEDGVHQTQSCRDYLACAEDATPDEVAALEKKYGEDGSCWQSTQEKMSTCDGECEDGIAALEDEYGVTCESTGGDTGGGDTGSSGACPLDDGEWGFTLDYLDDECGLEAGYANPWYGAVTCQGDAFELTFDNLGVPLVCTYSGRDFDCSLDQSGASVIFSGRATAEGDSATGSFGFDLGCGANGDFKAERQ